MKIKELMEELKKYDENTEVMIDVYNGWNNPSCDIISVYTDCVYDIDGHSTLGKCVYLEINMLKP